VQKVALGQELQRAGQAVQVLLSELAKVADGQEVQTPKVVALSEAQVWQLVPVHLVQVSIPTSAAAVVVAFKTPYPTAQAFPVQSAAVASSQVRQAALQAVSTSLVAARASAADMVSSTKYPSLDTLHLFPVPSAPAEVFHITQVLQLVRAVAQAVVPSTGGAA